MEAIENHLKSIKTKYSFEDIQIIYNEEIFGNIFISINDKNGIVLNFIRDRYECRVAIGTRKEMYLVEDVLEVLHQKLRRNYFFNLYSDKNARNYKSSWYQHYFNTCYFHSLSIGAMRMHFE